MTWITGLFLLLQDPAPQEDPLPGLVGHYYIVGRRTSLPDRPEHPARFLRVDPQIKFDRTYGPFPGTKLRDGLFVQWRGLIRIPKNGIYVFFLNSDDGSRLRIDGKKIVDNDGPHEMTEEDGDVELKAGLHELRLDYFNGIGHNGIHLSWQGPGIEKEVIPSHALLHRKQDEPTAEQLRGIEFAAPEEGDKEARRNEGDRDERDVVTVIGEILRIEGLTLMLVQKKDGGRTEDKVLKIDPEAAVVIDGERAKLEDLKPGRMARILVRRDIAVRVELPRRKREADRPEQTTEKPLVVDETIVGKDEKQPELGGRILSVFEDGPSTLVTIRQGGADVVFYIPSDAEISYVGLEKSDQKPTAGYLVYVWLKPGSKEMAGKVRFARAK
jgi:PA14 domain-containing protein